MKLVTAAQMRAIEAASDAAGVSTAWLMEQAGTAAAHVVWDRLVARNGYGVVVLVGPGNNGGDGLVAARVLDMLGADVHAYLLRARDNEDAAWRGARDNGVPFTLASDDTDGQRLAALLADTDCVVDALLGTGNNRALDGAIAAMLDRVRAARERSTPPLLVAFDVPTGVDADSGTADPHTVAADVSVCFGYVKVGLTQAPARALAGEIVRAEIGIPAGLDSDVVTEEIDIAAARSGVVPRRLDANKGTFGRAMIAAGSRRYPGAARLAAEACARSGAGLTTIAAPAAVQPLIAPGFPDATHEPLPSAMGAMRGAEAARALLRALPGSDALLLGPGLSLTPATEEFARNALSGLDAVEGLRGVVLDADALNALAKWDGWHAAFAAPRVLTPHPGEMARLLRSSVIEVQRDRLGAATRYARETSSVVILKGAGTVVAAPDGRVRVSLAANPMLATAGTGDVLAGILVGLLAQGASVFEAACAAVWVHAECGERVAREVGIAGGLAQDLLGVLAEVRGRLNQ